MANQNTPGFAGVYYRPLNSGNGQFHMPRSTQPMSQEQMQWAIGTGGFTNNSGGPPPAFNPSGAQNPYQQVSPVSQAPDWQSMPGVKPQPVQGLGSKIWRNKGQIAGSLGGWSGGAAAGAAIGGLFGGVGAIPGAAIGSVIGGLGGSFLGESVGGAADKKMNAYADRGQPAPVTDMASYGDNMMSQAISANRARTPH